MPAVLALPTGVRPAPMPTGVDGGLVPPPFGGPEPTWITNKYADDIWECRDINPAVGRPYRLLFNQIGPQYRNLAKWFLWLHEYAPDNARRGDRPVRSASRFASILRNFRWFTVALHARGFDSVHNADSADILGILEGWADRSQRHGEDPIAHSTFSQMLATLRRLYRFGPAMLGYLPDGLQCDPDEVAADLETSTCFGSKARTPELSEETARALFNHAVQWVETIGPALLELRAECAAAQLAIGDCLLRQNRPAGRRRLIAFFDTPARRAALARVIDTLPFPLAAALPAGTEIPDADDDLHLLLLSKCGLALPTLCDLMVAAVYIMVSMLSGFRVHEILSIQKDSLAEGVHGWTVRSVVRKTAISPSGVATERPLAPGAAAALQLLHRYALNDDTLFATARAGVLSSERLNLLIRRFARLHGLQHRLTTHQFRRFFALFYVRRFQGPLDGLRRHFRHVSKTMILNYVEDAGGAQFLAAAKRRLASEIMTSVVFGDGNYRSRGVGKRYERLRYRAQNLPPAEAEKIIREAITDEAQAVVPMEWGYCLVQSRKAGTTGCSGSSGVPADSRICPEACAGCDHLASGAENLPFWQQTALLHEYILGSPMATPLAKAGSARMVDRANEMMAMIVDAD